MTPKQGSGMPQRFEVEPHVGAGPIKLGLSRGELRKLMGAPFRTYSKVPGEPLTDTYFGTDLQVYYDASDRVEYIELNGPRSINPTLRGRTLLFAPAEEVIEWMRGVSDFDADNPELGYSYIYPALDLSLWRPIVPEGPEDVEGLTFRSVGVGRLGYYRKVSSA
jgi:hypothetical protein